MKCAVRSGPSGAGKTSLLNVVSILTLFVLDYGKAYSWGKFPCSFSVGKPRYFHQLASGTWLCLFILRIPYPIMCRAAGMSQRACIPPGH